MASGGIGRLKSPKTEATAMDSRAHPCGWVAQTEAVTSGAPPLSLDLSNGMGTPSEKKRGNEVLKRNF
ncbi:hypothetical protein TorRG33x02_157100 [Trema orientale]|uniref:Uncharacterized protein n=1 Tax=Trema orientale TaxID=63057 RepID=A0A2P5ESH3_TREOI|nr:hypothetical protein TorRG33x02_157100 [Trema orientale]